MVPAAAHTSWRRLRRAYACYGAEDYIGEPLSVVAHSAAAAVAAERAADGQPDQMMPYGVRREVRTHIDRMSGGIIRV
jgi:predicted HD phosphohydrolase